MACEGWIFTFHDYGGHQEPVVQYFKDRENAIQGARDFIYNYQFALVSDKEALHDFDKITRKQRKAPGVTVIAGENEDAFDSMDIKITIMPIKWED